MLKQFAALAAAVLLVALPATAGGRAHINERAAAGRVPALRRGTRPQRCTARRQRDDQACDRAPRRPRGSRPPANTAVPTLSGTPQDGQTLSASSGSWSGGPTGYAYQWQRCDSRVAACADISGATAASYAVLPADVASTLRVVSTSTNPGRTLVHQVREPEPRRRIVKRDDRPGQRAKRLGAGRDAGAAGYAYTGQRRRPRSFTLTVTSQTP
jgi:hypothetical protein